MMTFAPASANGSAQASPMPWPGPVTTAVFRSSLNFSRYIFRPIGISAVKAFHGSSGVSVLIAPVARLRLPPDDLSVLVEAMQARQIRSKPDAVAGFQTEFSDAACREHSEFTGVDIEKGVAAQMLGDRHGPGPAFALFADFQVFGPDAQRGDAGLARRRSGHEVHLGRADEAGHAQVSRPPLQSARHTSFFVP